MCEITAYCATCEDYKEVESAEIIPTEDVFTYVLECHHTIQIEGLKYRISYVSGSEKLEGKRKLPPKWKRERYKEISFGN